MDAHVQFPPKKHNKLVISLITKNNKTCGMLYIYFLIEKKKKKKKNWTHTQNLPQLTQHIHNVCKSF